MKCHRLLSTLTSKESIGFIGLGNMGFHMANNLLHKLSTEYNIIVYDINKNQSEKLATKGALVADNLDYFSKNCSIIITMVPNTSNVLDILDNNKNGLIYTTNKNTLFIDCSTIDPLTSKQLHIIAQDNGKLMLDAPVSGGITGAEAGTLTFMVGGLEETFNQAKPILSAMGKNVVHCGGAGNGGITKLCNNLSLAISMIGTSEAMSLGIKLGMDKHKLAEVMNTSTARCWSSETYNPVPDILPNVPSSRGYTGGFASGLMEKDLTLAMNVANNIKARLPLGVTAHQLYGLLCQHGYNDKDFSYVYEYISKNNITK